ncbi:hypothetical protein F7725_022820 [Dissostichus mawsoni]|uniref:VWFD domain-containing protein n=1 Tax=Dissostichus mawsoni TaxID=36200 RepID=A0A7J5YYY7_DISMA|nr:hypothetical protein F7725_022820 [Dissostichus mawsoni]
MERHTITNTTEAKNPVCVLAENVGVTESSLPAHTGGGWSSPAQRGCRHQELRADFQWLKEDYKEELMHFGGNGISLGRRLTYRPLLSEGGLPRSILHNYTARDSSSVPNQGQDRDGICRSWGQHHYETFDGIYFFYPGTCSYILAQDCHSAAPQYTVWVHNSRVCDGSVYSCPRALSLFFPNEEEIHISGYQVHQGGRRLSLPHTVGGVFIERLADYLLVKSVFGFSLAWDGGSGVYLKMSEEHQGAPCGLCGNFNHLAGDDLTTSRGIRTDEPAVFANSWAVDLPHERACPSVDSDFNGPCHSESDMDDAIEKCSALLFFPFLSCHENIDPNPFVASCVSDLCISDDEKTFVERWLSTAACSHVGYPMMAVRRVLSIETVSVAVHPPVHLRKSAWEPTCIVWTAATAQMVLSYKMERVSLSLSVHVFTMVRHMYKDMYLNKDVVFGNVCMGGVWNCTENNCTVECSVVGDMFVTTFDGRMFLQPGTCQYVLAKSRSGSRFSVTLQYTTCSEHQVCIQSVTVVLDEDVSRQITLTRGGGDHRCQPGIGLRMHYDGQGGGSTSSWKANGMDIHWDYVEPSMEIYEMTSCEQVLSIYRSILKMSPAGMIEGTPQLHANAWKVSSACVAPVNLPIIDPCEINQHNVFYASQCEVLMGSVFAPCHGYISPNIFQQQCRYQACRCGSSCLCTALAHYAYLCSKHGVNVDFGSHVSECDTGLVCLGGMLYHSCVSSCGRDCRALSITETCDPNDCAEGCGCPAGSYHDDVRQRCVQLSHCHCYSMGGVSQPGEVTFSASGPCLCRNGKMECVPEEKEEDSVEVGECPEGKVYHSCTEQRGGVACAPTCRNLMLNLTCPPNTPCVPGCVCPPGLVMHHSECYYPENCPVPGWALNTCLENIVCHRGYFNCSYSPCPAVCTVYSDRHYHTFDGLEYDYHSDCQVYLLKSLGETEVSIVAQNKDCYESGIVCMKILVVHVGLTKIYFTDNSGNPSPSSVVGRGSEFELWKAGYYTVVHFSSQELTILWDRKTTVHIRAGPRWKGLLSGLCGNFDSVTVNDMTTSSHMEVNNAQTFGDSWSLGQCESDHVVERPCEGDLGRQPYAKRECALLYSDVFAPCHNVLTIVNTIIKLGDGPFSLVSAVYNDTMFGVNRTSSSVFPLVRERPGQLPAPGLLFNFMVTAGLQKDKTSRVPVVSLESAERPNYFLVVSGRSRLQLEQWSRGPEFNRRATFIQHQGLFLPGHTSFELVSQPGAFLILTRTAARAQRYDTSEGFKASSSFTLEESSFVIPYRMMCEWRYQSCASPCVHTCSDPDATRCHFLPPVEGCFPRCPKNMVLDENHHRTTNNHNHNNPYHYYYNCKAHNHYHPHNHLHYHNHYNYNHHQSNNYLLHYSHAHHHPSHYSQYNRACHHSTDHASINNSSCSSHYYCFAHSHSHNPIRDDHSQHYHDNPSPNYGNHRGHYTHHHGGYYSPHDSYSSSPHYSYVFHSNLHNRYHAIAIIPSNFPPPPPTSPSTEPPPTTAATTAPTSVPETTLETTTTPQTTPADTTIAIETTSPTEPSTVVMTTTAPLPTTIELTTEPITTEIIPSPETSPPPYSYRIDDCAELICFNGDLLLHNSSLHCRSNTTSPSAVWWACPCSSTQTPAVHSGSAPVRYVVCRCTVMSDLRVITFDGNNVALYDNGSYILSPTGGTSGLCFKKLNITTSSYRIIINRLDRKVTVNYRPARLPFSRHALYVEDTGSMYLIHTPGGVSIQWYHSTGIMVLQYIATHNASVPTRGLCGCCDGNPEDDLRLPNGTVVREVGDMVLFLQAWRVHTTDETEHTRRVGDNCTIGDCSNCLSMLHQRAFMPCHSKVSPEQFCDIMWAGDLHYKDHQCDFLAAYVAVCYTHHVCISWRRHNFCPLRCPPGKEYQPCVSTCASRTCVNREYYEETTCSFIREECVCRGGTILHRADSPYCVTEDRCVCTDNEGNPRAPGEEWNGSARGCCLYRCMENGSVVAVEPDCHSVPTPLCEREGEYVLDVLEEGACCPKKICECNMTICDSDAPPCDNGNRLVIGYSALSCCPEYRCECDPMACPPVSAPNCREDQFLVEVRGSRSCCYSYLCVCESCIEPIPTCSHGEILAVDLNTTNSCCPQYHCVCDVNLCPESSVTCAPGLTLVQTAARDIAARGTTAKLICLSRTSTNIKPPLTSTLSLPECQCGDSSLPICQVGEVSVEVSDGSPNCGCPQHTCQGRGCLFQGVTVLGPGQSLVQYFEGELCYTVHCLHQRDPDSGFYAMEITSVNCTQKCGPHQVYATSTDPHVCCGSCKNVSCTFTNENGTTELFAAGSSWVENCTRYDCMETAVGAVILASGWSARLSMTQSVFRMAVLVQSYVDGCCRTFYSCDGKCPSATIFNFNINSHARFCKCCRESGLQTRSVTLYCSRNATVVDYNFQEPLNCSCQWN